MSKEYIERAASAMLHNAGTGKTIIKMNYTRRICTNGKT